MELAKRPGLKSGVERKETEVFSSSDFDLLASSLKTYKQTIFNSL
jgi:hypothetical protein